MLITQALTAVAMTVAAAAMFPLASQAQSKITPEEAHAIGVEAYVYFYPLLTCLLYTSPSPRDATLSRMPSSA